MSHNILLIDDDIVLGELLVETLSCYGLRCDHVPSGPEGIRRLNDSPYQLVVLDVMMPEPGGFETLRRIRAFSSMPVMMLTARGNPRDVLTGFELGADDYLPKPFYDEILVARIRALLRRMVPTSAGTADADLIVLGDLEIAQADRLVRVASNLVSLTMAEFETLRSLACSVGEIVSRDDLCKSSLGRSLNPMDRGVDNLVMSVRKKLTLAGCQMCEIRSARGIGYVLTRKR
jgi:DNA-binding response OmpR family regulator